MFAYCLNNPTSGCDPCGTCFHNRKLYNCEKCAATWKKVKTGVKKAYTDTKTFVADAWDDAVTWCVDTYDSLTSHYQQQQALDTQIRMQQIDAVRDAATSVGDAYMRGYNLQQEMSILEAQLTLDGVKTMHNFIDEIKLIDIGKASYASYQAANAFNKAAAYIFAPIPTVVDEFFAIGYALKGIYHLFKSFGGIIQ